MGQRPLTAQMEKKAALLAEIGLLDAVFMIFVTGAALMDKHAVVFQRSIECVQLDLHSRGESRKRPNDYGGMNRAARQVDYRQPVTGFEGFSQKSTRCSFRELKPDRVRFSDPGDAAETGTGTNGYYDTSPVGQLPNQVLFWPAVKGLEHACVIRSPDHCPLDTENIKRCFAGNQVYEDATMFGGRGIGKGGMPEHVDIEAVFSFDNVRGFRVQHRHRIAPATSALQPVDIDCQSRFLLS